mmetsp:Transcript_69190/g.144514  ORF Transcript_69190/g.144514 Transcript_69190/m.144514 type:complete len:619 (-) Transcript_69190:873-2729(-)
MANSNGNHQSSEESELQRLRREVVQLRHDNARLSGGTQVLKEGMLSRYREQILSQNWKKRFFDLRVTGGPDGGAQLRCFEVRGGGHLDEAHTKARMIVQLSPEVQILKEMMEPASKRRPGEPPYCFQLKLPRGAGPASTLRLGAESEEEVVDWIAALATACASTDGVTDVDAQKACASAVPHGPPKAKVSELSALRKVHNRNRTSVLTNEDGGIPECNVVGIVNLCVTVMVLIHLRLIYESIRKHGVLLDTFRVMAHTALKPGNFQCTVCFFGMPILAILAMFIEVLASKGKLGSWFASTLHVILCTICLTIPTLVVHYTQATPLVGATLLLAATTLFLKLVSFAHVNWALRRQWKAMEEGKKDDSKSSVISEVGTDWIYPRNLTIKYTCLFLAFPTLVYQTSYPRTERIRKKWLAKRIGELLVCLLLMSIITEQFVVPTLKHSQLPFLSADILGITVAVMKLAVPNVYLWLFMFYGVFHLWLNILAEVTFFGDRLFYKEWWNATKLEDYWRLWNLPVHHWLVKHIFLPVVNSGHSKDKAVFVTFLVSAVFHEFLVSVPCHTLRLWAFFGMMAQLPLVGLTAAIDRKLKGSQLGNIIFWISFCIVGQPLCVLLYFTQV